MSGSGKSIYAKFALVGAGVLVLTGLAGCVEEEIGPQFANNPPTATTGPASVLPTAAAATPSTWATPVAPATPIALDDVLGTRGAVPRVFLASSQTIWAVNDTGESAAILDVEPGEQVAAISPAPDASQVAAILTLDGDREASLVILDANGDLVSERELPAAMEGTPGPGQIAAQNVAVDWSPQGDRILLLTGSSGLFAVAPESGAPLDRIELGDGTGAILQPKWSPTGQQIAFLRVDPETRSRALFVHDLQSGETQELVAPGDGRIVVEFAWEPGGTEVLFTEGSALNSATSGIDLWRIGVDGTNRQLVAAAGAAAPVARITTVAPSPDGKSVAYVVLVPGTGAPVVDSVWVRDLAGGQGVRLGLPSVSSVENIWWTSKGLAIATVAERRNLPVLAVLLVEPSGSVSALWAEPLRAASPTPLDSSEPSGDQVEAASS